MVVDSATGSHAANNTISVRALRLVIRRRIYLTRVAGVVQVPTQVTSTAGDSLPSTPMSHKVAIVMGSGSDRPTMEKAGAMLDGFGIEHETKVLSAHKTPDQALEFASNAADNGFEIIIAGAGKAAHLAGVMAAKSLLPVIGVPLSATLDGMDVHRV
ncbi:MAG: AIR carboxylase family protein, partial [Acidimicrobiia bacterium]